MSAQRTARHVTGRSLDWAQVYPEWGLAGNAAFVIAPREVSRGVNLQRRVFLHSYEADSSMMWLPKSATSNARPALVTTDPLSSGYPCGDRRATYSSSHW